MRFGFVIVVCVMLVVVLDGGKGAEEQAADVGENGGAARGDAAFGEEIVEDAEGVVDALRPLEIVSAPGEGDTKIFGVAPGSEPACAAQKELLASATRERHWRPVRVRCWQRSGVKSELGDFGFILILVME